MYIILTLAFTNLFMNEHVQTKYDTDLAFRSSHRSTVYALDKCLLYLLFISVVSSKLLGDLTRF